MLIFATPNRLIGGLWKIVAPLSAGFEQIAPVRLCASMHKPLKIFTERKMEIAFYMRVCVFFLTHTWSKISFDACQWSYMSSLRWRKTLLIDFCTVALYLILLFAQGVHCFKTATVYFKHLTFLSSKIPFLWLQKDIRKMTWKQLWFKVITPKRVRGSKE